MTLDELSRKLDKIETRLEALENRETLAKPIPLLTPSADLAKVKKVVNYIINQLNIGIKNGTINR